MKRKFHVRFCTGGGAGDCPTDRSLRPVRSKRHRKMPGLSGEVHAITWVQPYAIKRGFNNCVSKWVRPA